MMVAIQIITAVLGLGFLLFGAFIFFGGKYSLINGFDEALKEGRHTTDYARRVGLVEFVLGILLLVTFVILLVVA